MPRPFRWILAAVSVLVIGLGAVLLAIGLSQDEPRGALDTELDDVTVSTPTKPPPKPEPPPAPEQVADKRCWRTFGADPQRSLARTDTDLGLPEEKAVWTRGMRSYIEFPPVYCEGDLYVNTFEGATYALDAETGKVQWRRRVGGTLPSSPAIDGPRVIVASQSGTVTALDRRKGRVLWQVTTGGKVESSPVVVDGLVYFGSHDGRLFAVASKTGNVRWAYSTGGRINASPSVFGGRVCAGNYSGAIFCLDKDTGQEIWTTYLRRDAFRRESFYASASTDGERLYSVSRSGSVVALDVRAATSPGRGRSEVSATRHPLSPTDASSWAASTGVYARSARGTARSCGRSGSAVASSARRSSSASTSSSPRWRRRRTRFASPTEGSPGSCRWAATRRASRPSGRTSSPSTAG